MNPLAGEESYAARSSASSSSERNHERDNMIKYHNRLGFSVNFTLTSGEVLATKADRRIFFPGCKDLETEGPMAGIFDTTQCIFLFGESARLCDAYCR